MTRKKGTSLPTPPDINSDPKASVRDACCNNTHSKEAEVVANKRPSRHAKLRDVAQTATKSNSTTSMVHSALQSTLSSMNATGPSSKETEGHAAEPPVSGLQDEPEVCPSASLNVNAVGLDIELPSTSANGGNAIQGNLTTVGNVFQSAGLHTPDTMPVTVQRPMVPNAIANATDGISENSTESVKVIPGKQPTPKVKNSNGKNLPSPIQSDLPSKRMKRSSTAKTSTKTVPVVNPNSELAVVDDPNAKRKRNTENVMPRPGSNAENYPSTPVAVSKAEFTMHPRAVLSVSNASVQEVPIPDTANVEERDELDKSVIADDTGNSNLTNRRISKRLMIQNQNRASKISTPEPLTPAVCSIQESAPTKPNLEPMAQSLQVNRSTSVDPTNVLNCNSSAPTPPIIGNNTEAPQKPLHLPTARRMVTRLQSRPPHTQSASDLVSLKSGNSSPTGCDSSASCFAKSKSVLPSVVSPSPPESTTTELSRNRAKSCLSKPNKSTTPAKKSQEHEESNDSTPEQLKKRKYWPRNSSSDYNIAKSVKGFKKGNDIEKCLLSIHHARHNNGTVKDTYHTDHIQRDVTGNPTEPFPEYTRDPKLCVVCKKPKSCKDDRVQKCSYAHPDNPSCRRFVHAACAAEMNFGGYLNFQASTCQGFCCPEHHCTQCFAVGWHKPAFTTDDKLIRCFACASKYHAECLPAGCPVSEDSAGKKFIVCPRHYRELKPTHLDKCFECEDCDENKDKPLFKCSTCPKSFHSKCHKVYQYKTGSSFGERCSNCFLHRFALVGDIVVVQFHGSKYHLAEVVHHNVLNPPRSLYPGFCAVKFILERKDPVFYTVSHFNLFFIKEKTMFSQKHFLNRMFELRNTTFFRFVHNYVRRLDEPREAIRQYIHPNMIRNSLIKVAERSTCQIGNVRNRTGDRVLEDCGCDTTEDRTRCSFSSCGNHEVQVECLPKCDEKGNCLNRFISKRQGLCDLKQAEVSLTKHGYYGVKTLVDVKKKCFIGEYCGEVISDEHISDSDRYKKIWKSLDCGFYFMRLEEKCIDAEYFGSMVRYMNHSCDPNCEAIIFDSQQGFHVCLFALKDIKQGEELTFSYTDKKRRDGDMKVKCKCFTDKCLGYFYV